MGFFRMRQRRTAVELPVKLYLKERSTGKTTSKYLSGTIVDISSHGASIVVKKVLLDGRHIFFQTQKTADHLLQLSGLEWREKPVLLKAHSVWMDSSVYHGSPVFKLGIHFTEKNSSSSFSLAPAELQSC